MTAGAAASVKSPEAFRTISEVAAMLDVPQHVLRFWESRFAHIKPVKRAGGRRFYRPEDVDLLRGIRALLYHEGYTIKGVQKVLRERGLRYVAELGRGEAKPERAVLSKLPEFIPAPSEPQFASAALAVLERAHAEPAADAAPDMRLADEERARMEILLAELQRLKARLRNARTRTKG